MASKQDYRIEGMDCADCAARIERKLQSVHGLEDARVNFAAGIVQIDPEMYAAAKREIAAEEPTARILERVSAEKGKYGTDGSMRSLLRIGTAAGLFLTAVLISSFDLLLLTFRIPAAEIRGPDLIFVAAYLLAGFPVILQAVRNLLRGRVFDEYFLMTAATVGAIAIGEWAEAAGVMLFYSVGEYLQERAVNRTRGSIRALMDLRPEHARLVRGGKLEQVAPSAVTTGDTIEVLPGERVPLDGEVLAGESFLDTSAITGESVPRRAVPGDEVLSGSVNGEETLSLRVTRGFEESSASRILRLVEDAASRKARTERFITRFARWYTPAVVALAAAVAVLPPLAGTGHWGEWLYRAFVVLVVSCPCALVLSVPLGYFGGIGSASRSGVLVKGGNYLDILESSGIFAFDKTGTVTRGVFDLQQAVPRNGMDADELLSWAAAAESRSTHPIAGSIRSAAVEKGIEPQGEIGEYREYRARGVRAVVDGSTVLAGSDKMMHEWNIEHSDCEAAGSAVYVAVDGRYAGYLTVGDEVKSGVREAIAELGRLGVHRTALISGDEKVPTGRIAEEAGIDEWHAELLPEEKVAAVEELGRRFPGRSVVFVGDGVNDAPVLARSAAGISMGGLGSDAAIEAADIVLMKDDLRALPAAIRIARRTKRIVVQNIAGALTVKLLFLALGAAGMVTMWGAVFADVGVTLLAVFNSLRALAQPRLLR